MDYKTPAVWTNDCQGKKNYDGDIVSISTRYWPERDYTPIGGNKTPPSAVSRIFIRSEKGHCYTISEREFEGVDFEEVKLDVEKWAHDIMQEIVECITEKFGSLSRWS